jgi:hypothetical protein
MKKSDTFGTNKASSGTSPTVTPSLSTVEEAKALGTLQGSAIIDSPVVEKSADLLSLAADTAVKHDMPSGKSNGTL